MLFRSRIPEANTPKADTNDDDADILPTSDEEVAEHATKERDEPHPAPTDVVAHSCEGRSEDSRYGDPRLCNPEAD